jgi:serine/threonine protein kinase
MTQHDDPKIRQILDKAAELPPDRRAAFLDKTCGGDAALRAEVESLLQSLESAGGFLKDPTISPNRLDLSAEIGSRIGRYKLIQKIGEGGMGEVFMAEQEQPVRRKVALKIIKVGMDTKQVVARFEAERQVLAMMEHPNIAKVLDAGATQTGRPYFVMELVRGVRITKYCDTKNLTTEQRLELFIPICRAVQHAHQKGIIHRDIKPSNVMVTLQDGVPVPKIIDFGIAKATAGRMTEKTLVTDFQQLIGTPEYMSPEQAEMSGLDVDTRADIYALGVLLYELLTGTTPIESKSLRKAAYAEVHRVIREVDPPCPSTRISQLDATSVSELAARRHVEPQKLRRQIRGELDWIVMKCLEKDRVRRYETANALAMDLSRHLKDEPIEASPASKMYRLKKLSRKYRGALSAAAVFVLLLAAATAVSAWEAVRARHAESAAVLAQKLADQQAATARDAESAALLAKKQADHEAALAKNVSDYLRQVLASANPMSGNGYDYTVKQLVDNVAAGLEKRFPDNPELEADLQATVGQTYRAWGDLQSAQPHLERAVSLRRSVVGEQSEQYAASLIDYSQVLVGSDRIAEAEKDARLAMEIYKAIHNTGLPMLNAIENLQTVLLEQKKSQDEVKALGEAAIGIATRLSDESQLPTIYLNTAQADYQSQNYDEAEALDRLALAIATRHNDKLNIAISRDRLSLVLRTWRPFPDSTRIAEAVTLDVMVLEAYADYYPAGHPAFDTKLKDLSDDLGMLASLKTLHLVYPSPDKLDETESLYRKLQKKSPDFAADGLAMFADREVHLGAELTAAGQAAQGEVAREKGIKLLGDLEKEAVDNDRLRYFAQPAMIATLVDLHRINEASEMGNKMLKSDIYEYGDRYLTYAAEALIDSPSAAERDPKLAVALASRGVAIWDGAGPSMLAKAYYRAGDYEKALQAFDKGRQMSDNGSLYYSDAFYYAMTNCQLGHEKAAREWYAKGVDWMNSWGKWDLDLPRYRDEADALLASKFPATSPASATQP